MKLAGSVVLVTGASSGIGRATAIEFGRAGSKLALVARTEKALLDVAAIIGKAGHQPLVLPTDLSAAGAPADVIARINGRFGPVDILVNNAGVGLNSPIANASDSDVRALFNLNVLVPSAFIQLVVPQMRGSGGMVINISSVAGRIPIPHIGYYSASKFALTVIGDALRMEEGHNGIRVMNVFPGMTESRFSENRLGRRGRAPHQRMDVKVPAEKVARSIVRAARRDRKNVYVSMFPDRLGVAGYWLAAPLFSAVLSRWSRSSRS
jgi:short-subunit dehydrogenase